MLQQAKLDDEVKNNDADLPALPAEPEEDNDGKEEELNFGACDMFQLYNKLQIAWAKIFIDIRAKTEFDRYHIAHFINLPFEILQEQYADDETIISRVHAEKAKEFSCVESIYVVASKDLMASHTDKKCYAYLRQVIVDALDLNVPIIALDTDVDAFYRHFPFLCNTEENQVNAKYPSQIINDKVFLGNMSNARNKQVLLNLGISHIVNATPSSWEQVFDVDEDLKIKYMQCPVLDDEKTQILQYFDVAIDFMENALKDEKHRVLVHCQAGVSRSSTIVIAYLMKVKKMAYKDAYKYTLERREIIEPNDGFIEQLKLYEKNGCVVVKQNKNNDT